MKHFERDFARRNIRGNKRHFAAVFSSLLLMALLLEFSFGFLASMRHTVTEQLFRTYGQWRFAVVSNYQEKVIPSQVEALPAAKQTGVVRAYASTWDGLVLGTVDEAAAGLGRLEYLEGRPPETAEEIAMEAQTLSRLGYSYELGQRISVKAEGYPDENGKSVPVEEDFVLTGVLRDTFAAWVPQVREKCPSLIVSREWALRFPGTALSTVLADAGKEFGKQAEEAGIAAGIYENREAYPKETIGSALFLFRSLIVMVSVVSLGILIVVMVLSVRKRAALWESLRKLGADRERLRNILFWESGFLSLSAAPLGLLLGFGAAAGLILVFGPNWHMEYGISPADALLPAGLAAAAVCLGTAFSLLGLPRGEKRRGRPKKQRAPRRYAPLKRLNALVIAARFMKSRLGYTLAIFFLLLSCTLLAAFVANNLSEEIAVYGNMTGYFTNCDYVVEAPPGRELSPLGENTLQAVGGVSGVEACYAYRLSRRDSGAFCVDLTGLEENPYLTCLDDQERCVRAVRELMDRVEETRQKILEQGNREAVSEQELFQDTKALHWEQMPSALSDYPVDLLGVDPDHEGERFLRAVQEGTVDREAFRRGEECILYLPAASKEPWNDTGAEEGAPDYWSAVGGTYRFSADLYALGEENPNPAKGIALMEETSVQPGDFIAVRCGSEQKQVRVGGIIRKMERSDIFYPSLSQPFQVVCSPSFMDSFQEYSGKGGCQLLTVKTNSLAGYSATDKVISQLVASRSGGYLLTNRRLELEQKSQDLASKVLMEALFLVLYCAAAFTVLGILFSSSLDRNRSRIALYRSLGLETGILKRSYLAEILLLSLGAVILTQLVLLVQWSIREASFVGTERGILSYLFTLSAENFLWFPYLGCLLLLFGGVFLSYYRPLQGFFRENFLEALK